MLRTLSEAGRLRGNRRFFRQVRKECQKVFGFTERRLTKTVPNDPSAFVHASRPRSVREVFGARLIFNFPENFGPRFPEKEVRSDPPVGSGSLSPSATSTLIDRNASFVQRRFDRPWSLPIRSHLTCIVSGRCSPI